MTPLRSVLSTSSADAGGDGVSAQRIGEAVEVEPELSCVAHDVVRAQRLLVSPQESCISQETPWAAAACAPWVASGDADEKPLYGDS